MFTESKFTVRLEKAKTPSRYMIFQLVTNPRDVAFEAKTSKLCLLVNLYSCFFYSPFSLMPEMGC